MVVTPQHSRADSRWREVLSRTGRWAHRVLLAGEWTWLRILKWSVGILIALIAAAVLWLYFLDWNTMRGPLSRYASARLGRMVTIEGDLKVDLFRMEPHVSVSGVKIANPSWAKGAQAADIPHLAFSFRLFPFLFGDTILPLVRFDRPDIVIQRRTDGTTNWDFGGGNTGWSLPPIQRFLVREGHIRIDDKIRNLAFSGTVSSEENAGAGRSAFQLQGNGTLNGNIFTAELHGGPLIHVDATKPYDFTAEMRAGATHVVAKGAIVHPFHLGQFWAATEISGANLSNLYDLTGLAMPHTAPYRMTGTLTRDGAIYQYKDFSGTVGSSDLHGSLMVDASGDKPFISGHAASRVLDFKDLGELFGGKSQEAEASGRLLPDLPLHVERLRQMDADVDYTAATIRSRDFPLRGVHAHIALKHSVLLLKPLTFQFARGRLAGQISIDAGPAVPVTSVDARLNDLHAEEFVTGTPPPVQGLFEAHAVLRGSGNSVRKVAASASGRAVLVIPNGKFRELFAELSGINLFNGLGLLLTHDKSDVTLRCAVADFDASNGVLRARRFVLDTENVRIEGRGAINLGDETLKMQVEGKPKELRIGRVLAPILITGRLDRPDIGIKADKAILQGGLAAALGFVFPPAALLPFIDLGLEKDANCAGLMTQARAQGAPVHRR